jgi:hypothetical protein
MTRVAPLSWRIDAAWWDRRGQQRVEQRRRQSPLHLAVTFEKILANL